VKLAHGLPPCRAHSLEDARLLRGLRLDPAHIAAALSERDDLFDCAPEGVDRPHPREVAHRRAEARVDVRVVGVDHRELAARRADRRDRDDMGVVGSDLRLRVRW
jgi:hypothetical protein